MRADRSYSSSFCETVFQQPGDCDAGVILARTGGASGTQSERELEVRGAGSTSPTAEKRVSSTRYGVPLAPPVRASIQGSCRKTVDERQPVVLLQAWIYFVVPG